MESASTFCAAVSDGFGGVEGEQGAGVAEGEIAGFDLLLDCVPVTSTNEGSWRRRRVLCRCAGHLFLGHLEFAG